MWPPSNLQAYLRSKNPKKLPNSIKFGNWRRQNGFAASGTVTPLLRPIANPGRKWAVNQTKNGISLRIFIVYPKTLSNGGLAAANVNTARGFILTYFDRLLLLRN
jgi:hypothetical protein